MVVNCKLNYHATNNWAQGGGSKPKKLSFNLLITPYRLAKVPLCSPRVRVSECVTAALKTRWPAAVASGHRIPQLCLHAAATT